MCFFFRILKLFFITGFLLQYLGNWYRTSGPLVNFTIFNTSNKNKAGDVNFPWELACIYMSQRMTKPTKWRVRQAKTQISLSIRLARLESSLSARRKLASLATHWAHWKDSDQTGRMPRLMWVFAGRPCHYVGYVVRWLNYRFVLNQTKEVVTIGAGDIKDMHDIKALNDVSQRTEDYSSIDLFDSELDGKHKADIQRQDVKGLCYNTTIGWKKYTYIYCYRK